MNRNLCITNVLMVKIRQESISITFWHHYPSMGTDSNHVWSVTMNNCRNLDMCQTKLGAVPEGGDIVPVVYPDGGQGGYGPPAL